MKTIKYIFLFCSIFVFSQKEIKNGKVIYDISITEEFDETEFDDKNLYKVYKYYSSLTEKSELFFNKNESTFNTINRVLKPGEPPLDTFYIHTKTRGIHYYNKETKEKLLCKESFGQRIILDLSKEEIKWNITSESKQINGYLCFKATANILKIANLKKGATYNVTAWFCPEIPLNFGPLNFNGLPGLILEIEYNAVYKTKLVATEIIFNDTSLKLNKNLKGKKMTVEEFEKLAQKIYTNRTPF